MERSLQCRRPRRRGANRVGCGRQLLARTQDGKGANIGAWAYRDLEPPRVSVEYSGAEVDDDRETAVGNLHILKDDGAANLIAGSGVVVDLKLEVVWAGGWEAPIGKGSLIGKCGPNRDLKCRRTGPPGQYHSGTDQQGRDNQNPYRREPAVNYCRQLTSQHPDSPSLARAIRLPRTRLCPPGQTLTTDKVKCVVHRVFTPFSH